MVKINRSVWTVADIVGMVLVAVGILGFIEVISVDQTLSEVLMAVGMVLIAISAVFIQIEGGRLRKEGEEYKRFDEIRTNARRVPNDLEESYQIDYTAEPSRAIRYRNNSPEESHTEMDFEEVSDDDVIILYLN
ncbi:MAG: hypothetical protein LBB30_02195 [Candidatus Methanoplasma sp.]|jgi:hypothetical protein|nr:hypothetical protein [Candidatus Methanoplasma sp.]